MYHDEAYEVKIESDEDGFHLILKCEALDLNIRIQDVAEQLHDAVRADIAPWLRERDEALLAYEPARQIAEFNRAAREAYGVSNPKHPDFHSIHSDIWDSREGK